MVEQNAKQALNIADKGYVLVQGRNAYTDTGAALMANTEVRRPFRRIEMADILNALVIIANVIVPGFTYGSQLALGAWSAAGFRRAAVFKYCSWRNHGGGTMFTCWRSGCNR